jgi:hypothetical protein
MGAVKVTGGQVEVLTTDSAVQFHSQKPLTVMTPDEARRVAIGLLEAAQDAERPEPPAWP